METIKIYRIEHDCGKGIFTAKSEKGGHLIDNSSYEDDICDKHRRFKTPYNEIPAIAENFTNKYFCAFKTLKCFYQWFKLYWLEDLVKLGFKIYEIEVEKNKCLIGEYQICFKKEDEISRKEITEIVLNPIIKEVDYSQDIAL